jgi:hypothetical protein
VFAAADDALFGPTADEDGALALDASGADDSLVDPVAAFVVVPHALIAMTTTNSAATLNFMVVTILLG